MRGWLAMGVGTMALGACSLITSYDDLRGDAGQGDSAIDTAPPPPPPGGCTLTVSPSLVTIDPILGTNVTFTLARGDGVAGSATLAFDTVAYVTPPSITFAASMTVQSGPFTLQPGASPLAKDIKVTALVNDSNQTSCQATATIAIPGVLATFPNGQQTSFVVPQTTYLTRLEIAAWGGGGGGGGDYGSNAQGGNGGAGGLSYALIDVTPGETLTAIAGGGGSPNSSQAGGGGGGCSEILRGATMLVVGAGGGGGGGGQLSSSGGSGGAGGQAGIGSTAGGAGTPTTGGAAGAGGNATAGGALDGGKGGGSGSTNGGSPGGGKGGVGGGGGCGLFGGGGGGYTITSGYGGGGGGGSGSITGDGGVLSGNGQSPKLDPTWSADAAVNALGTSASGGNGATNPQSFSSATAGGAGRITISIPP